MSSIDVIINLMARNEEMISRIYKAFSVKFPELGKFWSQLSIEEKGHADILRALGKKVGEGKLSINSQKINANQILGMLETNESLANQVEQKRIKPEKALNIAFEIEESMLEKNIFDVFSGDAPDIQHDFELLREHTKQHRIRLEKVIKAISI